MGGFGWFSCGERGDRWELARPCAKRNQDRIPVGPQQQSCKITRAGSTCRSCQGIGGSKRCVVLRWVESSGFWGCLQQYTTRCGSIPKEEVERSSPAASARHTRSSSSSNV